MRRVVQKNAIIDGEGKGYPYTVVADLPDVGIICKTSDGKTEILQSADIEVYTTYSIKTVPTTPTTDKKEVK